MGGLRWNRTAAVPVSTSMNSRPALCGSLIVSALVAAGCMVNIDHEGHIEREERRFEVSGTADLSLYTFDGKRRRVLPMKS